MDRISLLPNEIQDIIWNIYWKDVYTSKIINEINFSINKYFYLRDNSNSLTFLNNNTYQKKSDLIKYNKDLENLYNNKGINLLLNLNDRYFNIFCQYYISSSFDDKNLGSFYNFACIKSGYMRYHVLSDYKKILKK